jgi:hypothetical protein
MFEDRRAIYAHYRTIVERYIKETGKEGGSVYDVLAWALTNGSLPPSNATAEHFVWSFYRFLQFAAEEDAGLGDGAKAAMLRDVSNRPIPNEIRAFCILRN